MKKQTINTSKVVNDIVAEIEFLIEDTAIPKNLKTLLVSIEERLETKCNAVEISSIMYELEEMTNSNNVPQFCRSAIWSLLSKLENLKEQVK